MSAATNPRTGLSMDSPAPIQVAPARPSVFGPLREPLFRTLWITALISYTGSWMQNIAAGWLMTTLTSSPFWVSLVQVALSLPVFLIALPAGALADSVDRRKFLMVTQSSMVAAAAVLGVLTITGAVTRQWLLIFTFLLGTGAVMNEPAWQALIPDLVALPKLASAVALNSAGFNIARSVGPALGGLVIATAGSGVAFLLNAFSFLGVILFLYRWKPAARELPPAVSLSSSIGSGLRYARQDHRIQAVLVRTLAFSLFVSAFWALLPLIASSHGAGGYGIMLGCFGVGALIGAGLLAGIRRNFSFDAVVAWGNLVFAAAVFGLPRVQSLVGSCMCAAAAGLAYLGNLATLNFVAQTAVPAWVRARVMSLYVLALQGGLALGSVIWGIVASQIGITPTLTIAAAALCCGIVLGPSFSLKSGN
ncbi:MAG TPA: MFS transporter [Candidatus Angelobacter sp.]